MLLHSLQKPLVSLLNGRGTYVRTGDLVCTASLSAALKCLGSFVRWAQIHCVQPMYLTHVVICSLCALTVQPCAHIHG